MPSPASKTHTTHNTFYTNTMPSIQQTLAASNISDVFAQGRLRFAMLVAACQSGKTGAYQALITLMLAAGIVDHVYIICGSSETDLRSQAHDDTKAANPLAYSSGHVKVFFRQDFKDAVMDLVNALVIVDESHLDQTQGQELDMFFGRNGVSMDGNPKTLNEKNAFIVSVDATPYSELAARQHNESYEKHVETLQPGDDYFGLADYLRSGRILSTWAISKSIAFAKMVKDGGKKYGIMRLASGKQAAEQEASAIKVYTRFGGKVCYYTSEKTEIAITSTQKAELGLELCLEDAPSVPTLVIIRGRLRAGKVVPKQHIAFVWEGAKTANTDALVQGLIGRMCGYKFGETKPLIFVPAGSLKRNEDKVIKSSELERASMGFPLLLPRLATNLKKSHVANRAANGKTQCPPLRLVWDAEDDDWTQRHDVDDATSRLRCHALLMKNLEAVRSSPNYSAEQKKEILEQIVEKDPQTAAVRHLKPSPIRSQPPSQAAYFKQLHQAHQAGTAPAEHISQQSPLNFIIVYRGYGVEGANHRHLYVIFYTDATSGANPSMMAVDLKSRIAHTNGKSVFSVHDHQVDRPLVAGGVTGIDETKIQSPALMGAAVREYMRRYKDSELLTMTRCIQSNKDRFKFSKEAFHYTSSKKNDIEFMCAEIGREFGVKMKVTYTRSGSDSFNVKKIEW